MNKKGGFTDLFLFIIFTVIIVFISGIFIYIGSVTKTELHKALDNSTVLNGTDNISGTIDDTFGKVPDAYQSLYWISVFLIFGMILSIFIGSYMVTTKPVFFIPYIFVVIIAVIFAVGISNAYESTLENMPTNLSTVFADFVGANFILLNLPVVVVVIGFVGAIIMFSRMGVKESEY